MVYRPILRSGYTLRDAGSRKSIARAVRGATLNKLIFAFFTVAGASFPFLLHELHLESITLTLAVSLSIILVLGYLVLYVVQVLPSFVSSGAFGPLAQLPIDRRGAVVIAAMTLWRTVDYILVLSLATQIAMVAYFTGSMVATFIMLVTSLSSFALAIALALWLISSFQRRLERGTMSNTRALWRPVLSIAWGLGVMSVIFLFSLISFVAPPLDAVLAHPGAPLGAVASLIFPFSAGVLVSSLAGVAAAGYPSQLLLAYIGVLGAVIGALLATGSMAGRLNGIIVPSAAVVSSGSPKSLAFRVRSPLSGYIVKDLRVASRNPATGFLFALPLFEVLAVVLPITATSVVRMSALLVGTQVGGGFALFTAFLLVTVEDFGVERRTALPFRESVRTLSKVLVSSATYVPVMAALLIALLVKPSSFDWSAVVPLASVCSVFSACVVEVLVMKLLAERSSGNAARFMVGVGSGELVMLLPALAYTAQFLLSQDHWQATGVFASASLLELIAVIVLLRFVGRTGPSGRPS